MTHWQVHDAPVTHGTVRAACGQRVPDDRLTSQPTCPRCHAAADAYERSEVA